MKVLIQSRKNFYSLKGGDTVQLLKTKEQLEKLGVEVDISLEFEPDLSGYDLVHLSNVTRIQETYLQLKNALRQKKPVVLSTIYWPMDEFEKHGQIGLRKWINQNLNIDAQERVKAFVRYLKDKSARNAATTNLWKVGYTRMQEFVVNHVDLFLPNSQMEMDMLAENFGVKDKAYIVVPNAIDADVAKRQAECPLDPEFEKYRDAVICVGRIEPRKNQLALVKALDGSPYKLVLVGNVSENHRNYFAEIQKYLEKNPQFTYIPQIENDKLYQLFRVCRVSTLPSWLDTPGLVSLEAGVMGCNLAISSKGSTTEYFRDFAEYCLPDDIDGIRAAVDRAYEKERTEDLKALIFENYTWEEAARQTLRGYEAVLKKK